MIYFTSDLHLNHHNIIRYCDRPFNSTEEMNSCLLNNWNEKVSHNDKVYHLGDFCMTRDNNTYNDAVGMVKGKVVFLRGNHDECLKHANYYIYHCIKGIKIFMRHWTPWQRPHRKYLHSFEIPFNVDVILCGHVHNKWKIREYKMEERTIPVINVSTDVWDYKPISLNQIIAAI